MNKKLPNIYLIGFTVLSVTSIVLASVVFWDDYFQEALSQRKSNLKQLFSGSLPSRQESGQRVDLELSLSSGQINVGETVLIPVYINSFEKEVWGVDVRIDYDPEALEVISLQKGTYFQDALVFQEEIIAEKGMISYSLGSLEAGRGKGKLVIIKGKLLREGKTTLGFLEKTQVALKGEQKEADLELVRLDLDVY
ncbi:cohesin domain-containing protein [Patescibacteria group bacterium]